LDFSLSHEQRALKDSVTRVVSGVCAMDQLRRHAAGDETVAAHAWTALCGLGVQGILVPETYGGVGLGLLDAALVAEALGASAAPTAFLGSALAALAIRDAGSAAQRDRWLPALAAGAHTGGVALTEAVSGARDGAALAYAEETLMGTALFVMADDRPGMIVAAAGGNLYAFDGMAPGVSFTAMQTIDRTSLLSEMRCAGVAAQILPGGNAVTQGQVLGRVRDAAWILLAADMLGASQTMLDRAVAYAKERVQFGRTIGSFQAVKHLCADMAARLEPCRALVWYAAHAFDEGLEDAPLAAAYAKAHLSEVSRFIARTATEVHGGMGFTDLLGLHYWFKRVGVDRQLLGGPEQVRRHAARLGGLM
jgi:alkylation response protein AidB-like acyl-CoA dehydrogenase